MKGPGVAKAAPVTTIKIIQCCESRTGSKTVVPHFPFRGLRDMEVFRSTVSVQQHNNNSTPVFGSES